MSKKKNNKNVYQRSKVSTVQQPTRDKSKDKIYAIILCVFIVFWTVASVLGSIGFFRTSAEEIEVVPSNTITDDGWSITLDGLSGIRTYDSGDLNGVTIGSYTLEFQRQADYLILSHTDSLDEMHTAQWSIGSHTLEKDFRMSYASFDEVYRDYSIVNINTGDISFIFNSFPYSVSYVNSGADNFIVDIDFYRDSQRVGVMTLNIATDFADAPFTAYQYPMDNRALLYVQDFDYFTQVLKFLPYDAQDNYINGYTEGKQVGYTDGYSVGYNDGIADSNNYSFTNMIGAVLDGQINMFMGLFHFELLGVNLSSFFLAILTVCVIITIIKLLM